MANDKYLFVVSGAAGTGKDSVVKALREAHPEIEKTVSATTRAPRPGEQEGVDYYYRTREQFQQLIENDQVEAVAIRNPALAEDFRYIIKQHGGMLAKGRLLGIQFDTLFTDDLYYKISAHADAMADRLRDTLTEIGAPLLVPGTTNQVFAILPDTLLEELAKTITFCEQERVSDTHRAVRFCTSWATKEENVDTLCRKLKELAAK